MISDDAARLGTIASNRTAGSALASAEEHLKGAAQALLAAQNAVNGDADTAQLLAGGGEGETLKAQGNEVGEALGSALAGFSGVDIGSLLGQVAAFYDALGDTARQHGG